jgi:hypothetical protein
VETGTLFVTINYGQAGSGIFTDMLTFSVNADVQALWQSCYTNTIIAINGLPDTTMSAAPGGQNQYRSVEFVLDPDCRTGADVSWITHTTSGAGGTQLILSSGSVSLNPGQTFVANNVVEFIPGTVPSTNFLKTNFSFIARAPGAPTVNYVGPQFTGIVTAPPVTVASCNITSPQSGSSVSGKDVAITFDAQVPSGTLDYRVDTITSSATPTLSTPILGSINPVTGVANGSHTFNWDSIANGIGLSDRQDVIIRIIVDDATQSFSSSCLVQLSVNNSQAPACRAAPSTCGDVDSSGGININDALLTAQIAQYVFSMAPDLRCSDSDNVIGRCLSADVDGDGAVTGVIPVVPSASTDSGIIASYSVGIPAQLTCNNEQMIYNNSERLPIECISVLNTTDYCLAVPGQVTAAQLQNNGIRLYATDAQFPGPSQGTARFYVRVVRTDGISTTYATLQLDSLPTPYLVSTPTDVTVRSQGLLTYPALLVVVTDSGVCGIVEVTP